MHPSYRFFCSGTKFGTWFAFVTPVVATVAALLVGLAIGANSLGLALIGLTSFWLVFFCSMSISLFLLREPAAWLMILIGKMAPASIPIRMVDFDGHIYHSLAWEKDGEWAAPVYWGTNTGKVFLNKNGSCDRKETGYMYLWEPLRQSDRAYFFLMNIYQPSAEEFATWSRRERSEWCDRKRKEKH
jgi:hypothetical protein